MKELTIDLKNYKADGSIYKRTAVRGIVEKDGKYLIIHSKYGDYKFPGGGMEGNETHEETLIREMQEETGYHVLPKSMEKVIKVKERRKGDSEDIWRWTPIIIFAESMKKSEREIWMSMRKNMIIK